jgi:hypothetical protein
VTEAERDAERARHDAERARIVAAHDRDGTDGLRVVVLADRIAARDAIGARMVSALASRAEAIRVTVAAPAADAGAAERLSAHGVEVVVDPDDGWLRDRPMHASVVVVLGPAAALRYGRAVRERQPQAAIVYDPTGPAPADRLAARAAEAAIVAAAHVVLAPSRAHARFVEGLAPTAQVVPAAPGTPDLHVALAEALARSGVALPDAAFA